MNLTKLIEATGRRIRLGKPTSAKLTNAEVKEVLETAIEILKEALIHEGRVEIQHFAVIEIKRQAVKPTILPVQESIGQRFITTSGKRIRWLFHPSEALRNRLK